MKHQKDETKNHIKIF